MCGTSIKNVGDHGRDRLQSTGRWAKDQGCKVFLDRIIVSVEDLFQVVGKEDLPQDSTQGLVAFRTECRKRVDLILLQGVPMHQLGTDVVGVLDHCEDFAAILPTFPKEEGDALR